MISILPLKDVCTEIIDCPHESPEWKSEGIVVIRNFNLVNGQIDLSDGYFVDKETYRKRTRRAIPEEGDIIFSREAPIGNCGIVPKGLQCCLGQRLVLLKVNHDVCTSEYLIAVLQSSYVKQQIEQVSKRGSIVSNFAIGDLQELLIPVLDNQDDVAKFSSSIAEKIRINNAICSNLESMAKLLYDYWFVQFDFPDENGKPYKSSGGKMVWNEELKREIPDGWEVTTLGSKCQCLLGGTPSREKKEYWGGDINWINSGSVNEFRISTPSEMITEEGLKNTSTYLMPRNTTVLAITGATLGQVSILNIDACANQSVVGILETTETPTEYIYPAIVCSMKSLMNQQTGAAQPHVNKQDIMGLLFAFPPNSIMKKYLSTVKGQYEAVMEKCLENQQLASLRDFLLPMLMNGQVKVGDVKEHLAEICPLAEEEGMPLAAEKAKEALDVQKGGI